MSQPEAELRSVAQNLGIWKVQTTTYWREQMAAHSVGHFLSVVPLWTEIEGSFTADTDTNTKRPLQLRVGFLAAAAAAEADAKYSRFCAAGEKKFRAK